MLPIRTQRVVQKNFQYKYTSYILFSALISAAIIGGPAYYFLNQNYSIFIDLAYQHAPEIIEHLVNEQSWVNGFLVASILSLITFQIYFGLNTTFRMIGPLQALKRHIQQITQGQLQMPALKVRSSDEFHDLIENYNYLFKTLKAQTHQDIKKLQEIQKQAQNKEVKKLINELIFEKSQQVNETFSADEQSSDSRLVS